jgi:hypothetical protein
MHNEEAQVPNVAWPNESESWTWRKIVSHALAELGGASALSALYSVIASHARAKVRAHWHAKVRQVLQNSPEFVRVSPGFWEFSSKHSADEVERLNALRRERYPRKQESEG